MGDQVELLPCPFCGSDADGHITDGKTYVAISCTNCGANTWPSEGDPENEAVWEAAAVAWNTRTTAPAQAAKVLLESGIPDRAVAMATLPLNAESDLDQSAWSSDEEIRAAVSSALRAIAEAGSDG